MSIFRPTRRWLRFSLRTFLVFVTLTCICVAWYVSQARRQRIAAEAVRAYGGWVYYDYEFDNDGKRPKGITNESPWPAWLIEIFGVDTLHNVVEVNLVYSNDSGQKKQLFNTSDEIISELPDFPEVRRLYLQYGQVTDETMPHIAGLQKLEEFFAWHAEQLSDKGVKYLADLDRLSSIHISNSRIGDESLRIFSQLPHIERLSLQGNHFTDRGLRYLRDMKQLKALWIGFGQGEITDAGAKDLLKVSSLEELDLQNYSLSPEMQDRLKKLPKLKLLFAGQYYVRILPSGIPGLTSRSTLLPAKGARNEKPAQSEARRLPPLPFPLYDLGYDSEDGRH